ncbi:MAG: tRNA/rRNA methyltransferase SpoU [Patescibacteria group bacterium]|nr:tRNA/rRNA methyltransferase SpoU [Patescibacteria group bacterium]
MERDYKKTESVLVLHDIRSVINVGAMFRTADAIGVSRIVLSGYTPTPIDRFGRVRTDFAKASLGAEHSVAWEYSDDVFSAVKKLKEEGFQVIGIEQDKNSADYKDIELSEKIAILMGTETTGIAPELLAQCDAIAEIPMNGTKESLNVSVAAGIILYRFLDR